MLLRIEEVFSNVLHTDRVVPAGGHFDDAPNMKRPSCRCKFYYEDLRGGETGRKR